MKGIPASIYVGAKERTLTDRLGLAPDALPAGGNWYPEENVLELMVDLVEELRPQEIVVCGSGLSVPVLALAAAEHGGGWVTALDDDNRSRVMTEALLGRVGASARLLRAELTEYDKHNKWYGRWSLGGLPERIDLLVIDGPGHFAGRCPRWPAGPELFPRLSDGGAILLDDGNRVKEKRALEAWASEFPWLQRQKRRRSGGAVLLRREE
ncbi:MAG: class I SAM-dependent methyltransferase [Pseudomonadota bacterium]